MAKTSVEDLKARFKRGMFPTEGDFANVFDSYVHKDDGIDINDVTAENGSKTLTTLLQEFKQEILQDAKDQETQYDDTELKGKVEANEGNISSLDGRVSTNEGDISTLKDDLDTVEDNIAGHEIRIKALEERAEVPEGLAEFIEKVNSFLEDSDASDATINKWKEIEDFLQGITDTETLTGLLADLKQEILDEIPEQKEYTAGEGIDISEDGVISLKEDENKLDYVKVIADLDASTAPTGTVAIYTGDTNDKYTHGFIYEKTGEGGMTGVVKVTIGRVEEGGTDGMPAQGTVLTATKDASIYCGGKTWNAREFVAPDGKTVYLLGTGMEFCWAVKRGSAYEKVYTSGNSATTSDGGGWTPLNVMNVIN